MSGAHRQPKVCRGCHGLGARGQPTPDAFGNFGRAFGTLVEYLPSRRTQYRRPAGCRTSSKQCVGASSRRCGPVVSPRIGRPDGTLHQGAA